MEIRSVKVIRGEMGPDYVILETNLPSPYPDELSTEPLTVEFRTTRGQGPEYANRVFPGVPVSLITT